MVSNSPALPLPNDFTFREESTESPSISQLETMHKMLSPSPRTRVSLHNGAILLDAESLQREDPLLLLGIMSGNSARRRMLRCHWLRAPRRILARMRVRFVVGLTHVTLRSEWEEEPESWELRVNVSEGVRLWRRPDLRRHQAFTGTFSTYFKQAAFLRFAATQPEPMVGRADDDAFISPHMLLAYATLLNRMPYAAYAGVFEWISWRPLRLEATGFSYGLAEARGRAKAPHRNCSRQAPAADSSAYGSACMGPFGYAKGPLLLVNAQALQWLVRAPVFLRDLQRAKDMAEGRLPTRKGRIDDDINVGFWMAHMPNLRVVRLRRVVWKDTWRGGADVTKILAAHKAPWVHHDELHNVTSSIWQSAATLGVDAFCNSDVPPCKSCAHAPSQRPCLLEVTVEAARALGLPGAPSVSRCISEPKRGLVRCPTFKRESHPTPPSPFDAQKGLCVAPQV